MIRFTQDIEEINFAFNNNIIKFYESEDNAKYCDLVSDLFQTRLYPDPNGIFTLNLKEYVKSILNTNKFADYINYNIGNSAASLVKDGTYFNYLDFILSIQITNNDNNIISTDKTYAFIAGLEFLERYKRGEIVNKDWFVMSPVKKNSSERYKIHYWPGYPFDISMFTKSGSNFLINNLTNNVNITFPLNNKVNRIQFCDGYKDETIEDFLPLSFGINNIRITKGSVGTKSISRQYLELIKHRPRCGMYVKFRNQYGGWTYWLFHNNDARERNTDSYDSIANNNENLNKTVSPKIQSGKESQDKLSAFAVGVTEEDIRTLEYIVESPKIYLFTGEHYSRGSQNNLSTIKRAVQQPWIEIECKTDKIELKQPKRRKYTFQLEFAMPQRESVTLL